MEELSYWPISFSKFYLLTGGGGARHTCMAQSGVVGDPGATGRRSGEWMGYMQRICLFRGLETLVFEKPYVADGGGED